MEVRNSKKNIFHEIASTASTDSDCSVLHHWARTLDRSLVRFVWVFLLPQRFVFWGPPVLFGSFGWVIWGCPVSKGCLKSQANFFWDHQTLSTQTWYNMMAAEHHPCLIVESTQIHCCFLLFKQLFLLLMKKNPAVHTVFLEHRCFCPLWIPKWWLAWLVSNHWDVPEIYQMISKRVITSS